MENKIVLVEHPDITIGASQEKVDLIKLLQETLRGLSSDRYSGLLTFKFCETRKIDGVKESTARLYGYEGKMSIQEIIKQSSEMGTLKKFDAAQALVIFRELIKLDLLPCGFRLMIFLEEEERGFIELACKHFNGELSPGYPSALSFNPEDGVRATNFGVVTPETEFSNLLLILN